MVVRLDNQLIFFLRKQGRSYDDGIKQTDHPQFAVICSTFPWSLLYGHECDMNSFYCEIVSISVLTWQRRSGGASRGRWFWSCTGWTGRGTQDWSGSGKCWPALCYCKALSTGGGGGGGGRRWLTVTHCRCSDKVSPFMHVWERETGAQNRDKGRCACNHNVKREIRASTSSVVLVCVEELQAAAGSQQPLCAVQAGSHRLTDLLCRQGALCTQQHIEHPQLTGGEHHLRHRERKQSRNNMK